MGKSDKEPTEPAPAPRTARTLHAAMGDKFTMTLHDGGEFTLTVTKTGNKRIELELDPSSAIKRIVKDV